MTQRNPIDFPVWTLLSKALQTIPIELSASERWLLCQELHHVLTDPCALWAHLRWLKEAERGRQEQFHQFQLPIEPFASTRLDKLLQHGDQEVKDTELLQLLLNPVALAQLHAAINHGDPVAWRLVGSALDTKIAAAAALASGPMTTECGVPLVDPAATVTQDEPGQGGAG